MEFQKLWYKQRIAQTEAQLLREWRIAVAGKPIDYAVDVAAKSVAWFIIKKRLLDKDNPYKNVLKQKVVEEMTNFLYPYQIFWGHFGGPVSKEGWNLVPNKFGSNFVDPEKVNNVELHFLLRLAWYRGYKACQKYATNPF